MTIGANSISATAASSTSTGSTSPGSTSPGGSAPAGPLLASEAEACASRGYEVQQLAARMAACVEQVDVVLAQLVRVELHGWQSPAGRAYRTSLSMQAASLRRGRTALEEAVALVFRHAQNVVQSSGRPDD